MERRNDISEELELVGPILAGSARVTPFRVPTGYFDNLPAAVIDRIGLGNTLPAGMDSPFEVSGSYFTELPGSILAKITAMAETDNELAAITPLLYSIGKQTVYTVPTGYFELLAVTHPGKEATQPAKLVGLKSYRRWIQYAAAAVVTGVLISGAFLYTDSKSYQEEEKTIQSPANTNASVTAEPVTIEEARGETAGTGLTIPKISTEKHPVDFAKKVEQLSEDEIQNYLEENAAPEPVQIIEDTTSEK